MLRVVSNTEAAKWLLVTGLCGALNRYSLHSQIRDRKAFFLLSCRYKKNNN